MAELIFDIDNSSLETVRALNIGANFDEMEAALTELIEPYKNMIVTEDDLPQAKTDRAKLRKVSGNIDDRRKLVKKIYSEPLKVFEENCKRLTAVCDQGINNLDCQIKEYENSAKEKKIQALRDYFDGLPKQHPGYARFSDCENPKWANLTYSFEDAQKEIENYVLRVDTDVTAILALESKYEPALLDEYRKTCDVSATLMLKQRLEQSERIMEEKRLAAELAEQQRRQAEEQRRIAAEKARQEHASEIPPSHTAQQKSVYEDDKYAPCSFNVICRRQADEDALFNFCVERGITITKGGNVL